MKRPNMNGALDPRAYQQIVGATFAGHDHKPLITIGSKSWTRWQLGRLGCPHPAAAVRISRVIKTLGIKTTDEFLAAANTFGEFRDVGVTSYWVVLALAHDLGKDPEKVHGKDRPSFATVHKHALNSPDESLVRQEKIDNEQSRTERARRMGRQAKARIHRTPARRSLRRVS